MEYCLNIFDEVNLFFLYLFVTKTYSLTLYHSYFFIFLNEDLQNFGTLSISIDRFRENSYEFSLLIIIFVGATPITAVEYVSGQNLILYLILEYRIGFKYY